MFDWARGSALRRFIDLEIFMAGWDSGYARWLKNWHTPWLLGLVEFNAEMSVLDIGSSRPWFMKYLHKQHGCDVHALDLDASDVANANFGFSADAKQVFPEVTLHFGLAGDRSLPAERFDVVTCISTLEHTYDRDSPLSPRNPMPHLNALRDMVRVLKPGGLLLMNWNIFLDGVQHHVGWDFEIDTSILLASGMQLACKRRVLRATHYLFDHPDSIFFEYEEVLQFNVPTVVRGTAVNILWRKPGNVSRVVVSPRRELEDVYFPPNELQAPAESVSSSRLTTDDTDRRFEQIITRITDVLRRNDATGYRTDRHGKVVRFSDKFPFTLFRRSERDRS
jgi:SAM-dependent methyltransferase